MLDSSISVNVTQLVSAAISLGAAALVAWACLHKSKNGLPLPPSPPNWRPLGHFLSPHKYNFIFELVIVLYTNLPHH
jgi:hypothetical protein